MFVPFILKQNYTAIIDHQLGHCFVMKLNRTAIAPPRDLIDLLDKLMVSKITFVMQDLMRAALMIVVAVNH